MVKERKFNVKTNDGRLMLSEDVDYFNAVMWCAHYTLKHRAGKPYPNGQGVYPEFGFEIVERV